MAKKKKKNSFDLVNSLMFLVIITIVACVSNFSAALQEPIGSAIVSINIISTGLFLLLWASQAFLGGRARSRGFLITILAWWGGGILLFKLVDVAMATGSDMLYYIGFYGLLLIVCPTYALIPVCVYYLHIDYFMAYPALLAVLLALYFAGRKWADRADAKKREQEKFMQKVEDPAAPAADPNAIPEAARAAAEAMRAAAEAEKAQAAEAEEKPAE